MTKWEDKVVLITGGSSGIGKAAAMKFADKGATLFLVALEENLLKSVKDDCIAKGLIAEKIRYIFGDLTRADFRALTVKNVIERYGKIDILVYCAGTAQIGTTEETREEDFDRSVEVNQKGTFFFTQLCIPHLKASKGNIVILSSSASQIPLERITVYCMIKASLDMFTKCLAKELGPFGVRVNAINPGYVQNTNLLTDILGKDENMLAKWNNDEASTSALQRTCEASEVADLVLFLSSDEASFITGNTTFIDGGKHLYIWNKSDDTIIN